MGLARWLRVLVDNQHVVYAEVVEGVFPQDWQKTGTPYGPDITLPPFPPDWVGKTNHLVIDNIDQPVWVWRDPLPVTADLDAYRGRYFDYASIEKLQRVFEPPRMRLEDRLWKVRVQILGSPVMALMKICDFPRVIGDGGDYDSARFAAEKMQQEIVMHQQAVAGAPTVVPAFLGLVTEPGRGSSVTLDRVAMDRTLNIMLQQALERLHNEARVVHNDMNKGNVLVKTDRSEVFLIDFEHSLDSRIQGVDYSINVRIDNMIWSRYRGG
ncbi:hypothetical protein PG997_006178 [Apiospora hydei]|uniref:Protein kinase domain-containing protein n=1 Tax=Apiospora hydei TaxID=1337664 RepID=A0ABR1WPE1_9PEZI